MISKGWKHRGGGPLLHWLWDPRRGPSGRRDPRWGGGLLRPAAELLWGLRRRWDLRLRRGLLLLAARWLVRWRLGIQYRKPAAYLRQT